MKIGLCSIPSAGHPTSLLCLLNSTAMSVLFKSITKQFTSLYKRKVILSVRYVLSIGSKHIITE